MNTVTFEPNLEHPDFTLYALQKGRPQVFMGKYESEAEAKTANAFLHELGKEISELRATVDCIPKPTRTVENKTYQYPELA